METGKAQSQGTEGEEACLVYRKEKKLPSRHAKSAENGIFPLVLDNAVEEVESQRAGGPGHANAGNESEQDFKLVVQVLHPADTCYVTGGVVSQFLHAYHKGFYSIQAVGIESHPGKCAVPDFEASGLRIPVQVSVADLVKHAQ